MKKMLSRLNAKKNNKGFTLVELIIVIAIIAVLAAVLAPQYVKYVERSRQGVDASTLEEIKHNVEIEAGITEGLTAGTVTITVDANNAATVAAVTTNLNDDNVNSVVGTVKFKSSVMKSTVFVLTVNSNGSIVWAGKGATAVTNLQAGTAVAADMPTAA